MKSEKLWKVLIFVLLLFWFGVLMAQKADLTTSDLGRHLQNGKWVLENHFDILRQDSPLFENFYSYTNPDFSVPNHHWGSGIVFYSIYKFSGFAGLSLIYVILSLLTLAIFFRIAAKESDFTTATLLALLLVPLMAERREIRPEVFSYFFAGIFFWLLWSWRKGKCAASRLYILPLLMIFWVNLHVYFFLGIFLIGVFWLTEASRLVFSKLNDEDFSVEIKRIKNLSAVALLSVFASLLNPFGWRGLVYPLQIFRNYGYTIVENKSVWFVERYGIQNSNFTLVKVVIILLVLSFALLHFTNRRKISARYLLFALCFGSLGWLAIRNFTLLGFFALPILAANAEGLFSIREKERSPARENGLTIFYAFVCLFAVFSSWQFLSSHLHDRGFGLLAENGRAGGFLRENDIKGPIFNNYDIGGYLIWNLYPQEKVFVDNRPEAYPDSFFEKIYKPMQESRDSWKEQLEKYGFNAVVFSNRDVTPWGQSFLEEIAKDNDWARVYKDGYAVIFLRRNQINDPVINRYQIPDTVY